jgi:hypothetical protein
MLKMLYCYMFYAICYIYIYIHSIHSINIQCFILYIHIFDILKKNLQVEYALKAIEHAGAAVGVLCTDGVVLGTERKVGGREVGSGSGGVGVVSLDRARQGGSNGGGWRVAVAVLAEI